MVSSNLLIVGCSQAKTSQVGLVPAIERYDGPTFRLIRKYRNSLIHDETPRIEILSAKYGLINEDYGIPLYDQKMTPTRAEQIRSDVIDRLQTIVDESKPKEIFVSLSKVYELALVGFTQSITSEIKVTSSHGTPGRKLSELYEWLYGKPNDQQLIQTQNTVIRGIEINLNPLEVINLGREKLSSEPTGYDRFQTWFVLIDGTPVSTKWLVSKLTGLPVSKFGGTEARRVLKQLGITVKSR